MPSPLKTPSHQPTSLDDGKHVADPTTRLAVLFEFEGALHDCPWHRREAFGLFLWTELLSVQSLQFGLVVIRVHRARTAGHEQLNDTAYLGWMMQATIELSFTCTQHIFGSISVIARASQTLRRSAEATFLRCIFVSPQREIRCC